MTRVQHEHDKAGTFNSLKKSDMRKTVLTRSIADRMKDYAVILHPLPRNEEIEPDVDSNPRARYFEQAENGQWIRAALLAHTFDAESTINEMYEEHTNEIQDRNEHVLP